MFKIMKGPSDHLASHLDYLINITSKEIPMSQTNSILSEIPYPNIRLSCLNAPVLPVLNSMGANSVNIIRVLFSIP